MDITVYYTKYMKIKWFITEDRTTWITVITEICKKSLNHVEMVDYPVKLLEC